VTAVSGAASSRDMRHTMPHVPARQGRYFRLPPHLSVPLTIGIVARGVSDRGYQVLAQEHHKYKYRCA